jgi:hypothetical protein
LLIRSMTYFGVRVPFLICDHLILRFGVTVPQNQGFN